MLNQAKVRAEALRLSLSAYVQRCVEEEVAKRGGPMVLHERTETAALAAAPAAPGKVRKKSPRA